MGKINSDTDFRKLTVILFGLSIFLFMMQLCGCSGGGDHRIKSIVGPTVIEEYDTAQYSVANGEGMSFSWSLIPEDAGVIEEDGANGATVQTDGVGQDEDIRIQAINDSADHDPLVLSLDITVKNNPDSWVRTWGGHGHASALGVASASDGGYYVTGYFKNETDFKPGPKKDSRKSAGLDDAFLMKFDSEGEYQWVKT
jgi:hypothetical protein